MVSTSLGSLDIHAELVPISVLLRERLFMLIVYYLIILAFFLVPKLYIHIVALNLHLNKRLLLCAHLRGYSASQLTVRPTLTRTLMLISTHFIFPI
jgi:hypothetical protein